MKRKLLLPSAFISYHITCIVQELLSFSVDTYRTQRATVRSILREESEITKWSFTYCIHVSWWRWSLILNTINYISLCPFSLAYNNSPTPDESQVSLPFCRHGYRFRRRRNSHSMHSLRTQTRTATSHPRFLLSTIMSRERPLKNNRIHKLSQSFKEKISSLLRPSPPSVSSLIDPGSSSDHNQTDAVTR